MNRTFKKALSALLVSSMIASGGVAQLAGALPSFADEKKIPDKVDTDEEVKAFYDKDLKEEIAKEPK